MSRVHMARLLDELSTAINRLAELNQLLERDANGYWPHYNIVRAKLMVIENGLMTETSNG